MFVECFYEHDAKTAIGAIFSTFHDFGEMVAGKGKVKLR
jgi:hypothetical protein